MDKLDEDICAIFKRRAYDMAASVKGVKIFLNGKKVEVSRSRLFGSIGSNSIFFVNASELHL